MTDNIYMKNNKIRKVVAFTSNRSEFGVLVPILKAIEKHPNLDLSIIVAGSHYSKGHGFSVSEILNEKFKVCGRIPFSNSIINYNNIAENVGLLTQECSKIFTRKRPDFVLLLGDRFELLAPATAAFLKKIVIAHVSGGDNTKGGLMDDTIRHTVSKLSHIHFPGSELSRKRLLSMGEETWRVFNVGEPCIDNLFSDEIPPAREIAVNLGIDLDRRLIMCTIHPPPLHDGNPSDVTEKVLIALKSVDAQKLITYPNGDPGSRDIIKQMGKYFHEKDFIFVKSLGRIKYTSLLKKCACVIGNSSSVIVECPPLHIPSINLGTRQLGRFQAKTVLNAKFDVDEIIKCLNKALYDKSWKRRMSKCKFSFGKGKTGEKIAGILSNINMGSDLLNKKYIFHLKIKK